MVTEHFEGKRLALTVLAIVLVIGMMSYAVTAEEHSGKKFKRMIAEEIGEKDIKLLKEKGCLVKNKLRRGWSFDCPEGIETGINAREARIFYVTDLAADTQIEADKVWSEGITGNGVKVAVLDTGIDTDHPELADSYLGGYDYVNNDAIPEDDHGHGTHVSGIITGNGVNSNAKGVAPGAKIYMYKVCNATGACYEDDMIAAMEAAMKTDAKVMSISIGGGSYTTENCDSDSLAAEVNKVVDSGITVAVAAGNNGKGVSSPGCASKAIAVGAVDKTNNVAYFSGRGKALDIVAPGVSIYSTYLSGGYATMSGTSMATPHVAGVVALLLEANSGLTTAQIKDALYTTTNPVNKCYNLSKAVVTCTRDMTGAGIVDAYKAYLKAKSITPPQPECTVDANCSDGLYCNGAETCSANRVCLKGTNIDCSASSDQCNTGVCDENAADQCIKQPKSDGLSCNDGLYCNTGETCQQGICKGGSALVCNDGVSCTKDQCNENTDSCVYTWPSCGITDGCCATGCGDTIGKQNYDPDCKTLTKCWSGASYRYIYRDLSQVKKFCKCAMGTYGVKSYTSLLAKPVVYMYTDTGNNTIWTVKSTKFYPVTQATCLDGKTYATNKDYNR